MKILSALVAAAVAAGVPKEQAENYALRCVNSGQQYNTNAYTGCRSMVNQWRCCTKWVYKWQGLAHCNQIGGHLCAYKSRQCGSRKGYYFKARRICKKTALHWKRAPGAAWNIAHNANKIWVIGTNKEAGGWGIYRWDSNHWTKIPGSAIRVAVDKFKRGWVVNKNAYIFWHNGARWFLLGGRAWDIDVGSMQKLWVIGTNREAGGFGIYRWDGHWTKIPGSAVRIGVDGNGNGWVVNKFRRIFRSWGGRWYLLNGLAFDIGVHDGNVIVIGTDRRLWRRWHTGNSWDVMNAFGMKSVGVGPYSRSCASGLNASIWAGW